MEAETVFPKVRLLVSVNKDADVRNNATKRITFPNNAITNVPGY